MMLSITFFFNLAKQEFHFKVNFKFRDLFLFLSISTTDLYKFHKTNMYPDFKTIFSYNFLTVTGPDAITKDT